MAAASSRIHVMPSLMVCVSVWLLIIQCPHDMMALQSIVQEDPLEGVSSAREKERVSQLAVITEETSDLSVICHPFLNRHHLHINAEFHILICHLCQEAILTRETVVHLQNKHTHLASTFKEDAFQQAIQDLSLVPCLPEDMVGSRTPIHGLPVQDCLHCPHCAYIGQHVKVLQKHHQQ